MAKPDITVAICTHDHASMLDRALAALAAQRVGPGVSWELVIVDNASTDATADVLAAWRARNAFPVFRAVREERLGLAHARRRAIAEARSELIAFVDDDCLLDAGWVDAAASFGARTPAAGAFGGRVDLRWEAPPTNLARLSAWTLAHQDRGDAPVRMPDRGGVALVGAGLVVRRAAVDGCGWLDTFRLVGRKGKMLTSGDDAEIVFQIRAAGWEVWYDPAMRLEHVIPAARMEPAYLTRLHRAIGRVLPHISVVSGDAAGGAPTALRFMVLGLAKSVKKTMSVVRYGVSGNAERRQRRWLEAHYWFGVFLGALRMRPSQRPPRPAESSASGPGITAAPAATAARPTESSAARPGTAAPAATAARTTESSASRPSTAAATAATAARPGRVARGT